MRRLLIGPAIGVARALRSPRRHVLGAITAAVAVAAVVATFALVEGSRVRSEETLRAFGLLTVQFQRGFAGGPGGAFEPHELASLRAAVAPHATDTAPLRVEAFSVAAEGRDPELVTIVGTHPGYRHMSEAGLADGRWFDDEDVARARPVAVIDAEAAVRLFGEGVDPIGRHLEAVRAEARLRLEIIGVVEDPMRLREPFRMIDSVGGARHLVARLLTFRNVYVPDTLLPGRPYVAFCARARDPASVEPLRDAMVAWMGHARLVTGGYVWARRDWIGSVTETLASVSIVGGVVASLVMGVATLLVATVNLVAVRVRSAEIAVRRAEGATRLAVLGQFLAEGTLVAAAGGVLGLGGGVIAASLLGRLVAWDPVVTGAHAGITLILATAVGLIGSVGPAWTAARLDPAIVLAGRDVEP